MHHRPTTIFDDDYVSKNDIIKFCFVFLLIIFFIGVFAGYVNAEYEVTLLDTIEFVTTDFYPINTAFYYQDAGYGEYTAWDDPTKNNKVIVYGNDASSNQWVYGLSWGTDYTMYANSSLNLADAATGAFWGYQDGYFGIQFRSGTQLGHISIFNVTDDLGTFTKVSESGNLGDSRAGGSTRRINENCVTWGTHNSGVAY